MKQNLTMSFLRSEMPYDKRIAILPEDLKSVKHCEQLYFESGYGKDFLIEDACYETYGCHIVSKEEALQKDILCDTKIGNASYLNSIGDNKIITGWIHAGADKALTNTLINHKFTCYAWENFYKDHRHLFWKNNRIAGAGGVINALQYTGYLPDGLKAGIIGRGDSAAGAFSMLSKLGVIIRQYNRKQEALFVEELPNMDIVVMAIRWDTLRTDHLITSIARKSMKKTAIIIDISDDANGAIEQSRSTLLNHPIYYLDDIMIYSVGNVPNIFYKSATASISEVMCQYIDYLVEGNDDPVLSNSVIIKDGVLLDEHILKQQHR